MSEELKEKMQELSKLAESFPDAKSASVAMDRTADFLAGAAAMASAMKKEDA